LIGFFGGTFDPIHYGHLHAARTAASALRLEWVALILAARPGHRVARATIEQRWQMLQLALAGDTVLRADDREIRRSAASYTVDTLKELRAERGHDQSFVWLLGWDAYRELPSWNRWEELLSLSHLGVLRRPGVGGDLSATMTQFTRAHAAADAMQLHTRPAGLVTFVTAPMLRISATVVRDKLGRGEDVADLLPSGVRTYINQHHLYGGQPT
jgi:nicotinate-nucleotide adenylyltransferase